MEDYQEWQEKAENQKGQGDAPPHVVLFGERVRLRPLRREDLPERLALEADPEVQLRTLGEETGEVSGLAGLEEWFSVLAGDPRSEQWAVEADDGTYIGDLDLHSIGLQPPGEPCHAWLNAFFGRREYWGRGLEEDAVRTLLVHARRDLGVERISTEILETDSDLLRVLERVGFRLEERLEKAVNGKDVLALSIDLS